MDVNQSSPVRGEKVQDGRVVTNQIDGSIDIYNSDNELVMRLGNFTYGGEQLYGIAIYDDDGNVIIREGFLGLDSNGNPLYGRILNDGTTDRTFEGKQVNGF